jgi:translation initiation factor RLI1
VKRASCCFVGEEEYVSGEPGALARPVYPFIGLSWKKVEKYVDRLGSDLSLEQQVRTLSGGNQQKVVVGRWLPQPDHLYHG